MRKLITPADYIGKKYNRLTIMSLYRKQTGSQVHWYAECKCDCGAIHGAFLNSLDKGTTQSCGCYRKERSEELNTTHSQTKSRLYRIWCHMKDRCYNENIEHYNRYGGRGIKICDEWRGDYLSFHNWAMANGYQKGLEIDREDNDGNYEPNNCRWVTRKKNCNNTSKSVFIFFDGERFTAKELSEHVGIPYQTFMKRYYQGQRGEYLVRPLRKQKARCSIAV